jgi:hypothetical protein
MAQNRQRLLAVLLCGGLCAVFAAVAWTAVSGKSATWDEPSHAATGWMMRWQGDYRFSPDVPPLWEDWIALGMGKDALTFNDQAPRYRNLQTKNDLFAWCVHVLYRTAGNDGIALVNRGRVMALVLGVALAGLIGLWAWRLGGVVAAVAAVFVYCLDPNFLGHAPLVKNDVGFALVYFAAAYAIWRVGQRAGWMSIAAVALLVAAAVCVKLSGLLLGPVLAVGLTIRAIYGGTWNVMGREIQTRAGRLGAAVGICMATALVVYVGLWASYGFRFEAGPGGLQSDTHYFVDVLQRGQTELAVGGKPTQAELDAWRMPLSTRAMLFIESHRLLPQAWTCGYVLTQAGDLNRAAYLLGKIYIGGRWFYFPLAALFKAPLATIAAVLGAIWAGRMSVKRGAWKETGNWWAWIAMLVPTGMYAAAIMTANLNIGVRHAFPLYPFVFVGVGLAARMAWEYGSPKPGTASAGRILVLALGALLAAETAAAYPNYIAFFNMACAPERLSLLSDSNLDWGQDLTLLAAWQAKNPDVPLYLEYFGLCDPAAYGIKYQNAPGGYVFGDVPAWPTQPGMVAISATDLQQVFTADPRADLATYFQTRKPQEILGETIYLF